MKEYENYVSDEEVDKQNHARLVDEVFQLDKKQYVKKPSRTEPAIQVSEFNLIKSKPVRKPLINIRDLTKSLKKKDKHVEIARKIKNAQTNTKTLITPASKIEADKIRRTLGYQKVSSELGKWEAIVEKNRFASQITFPLNQDVNFPDNNEAQSQYRIEHKSELDIELEKLEPAIHATATKVEFPLSMEELIERRKEMAKLRAHQSYLEAKAYKRNKIKSKTFHKIDRKAKLKEKIKEFEILRKTNPEAALEKLEELEKVRAEERMSLRHRSTGHWARNKQIQAKYNKESRQALAQQLTLSRELTEKMKVDSSDSESEETLPQKQADTCNPWIKNKPNEVQEFVSGYRKFWNEQNKINPENKAAQIANQNNLENVVVSYEEKDANANDSASGEKGKDENNPVNRKRKSFKNTEEKSSKKVKSIGKIHKNNKSKQKNSTKVSYCNSKWDIEDLFDELEVKKRRKLEKLTDFTKTEKNNFTKIKNVDVEEPKKSALSMKREKLRPEIDEEIGIVENDESSISQIVKAYSTQSVNKEQDNIDVVSNKYANVKTVDLQTVLPTISSEYDNVEEDDNDQRAFISEAFEDDDIVEDFSKEKQDIIAKEKPNDIDLTLPGWGCWGGKDIKMPKRKNKRFIVKMPEELPRKDKNRHAVIINEKKNSKLSSHQVSELPFPFRSVKDFEASIRTPIGDTFVPQTAFTKLIKPAVVVKQGSIVEPMSKDILLKHKFTTNGRLVKDKKCK